MIGRKRLWLVFSDLDGTLLDENYSCEEAQDALGFLKERGIPVILCSSKTRKEIELYRRRLSIEEHPFVSENGGGIFIPKAEGYEVIRLGIPHERIVESLDEAKVALSISFNGFHELSPKEISRLSGLSIEEAVLAKDREFSETILIDKSLVSLLEAFLRGRGLRLVKGSRFYSVIGGNDKGKAIRLLIERYRRDNPDVAVVSIGLGDSENDFSMLEEMDYPVLVRRDSVDLPKLSLRNLYITERSAPFGWAEAIFRILGESEG